MSCLSAECISLIAFSMDTIERHEKLQLVCRNWREAIQRVTDGQLKQIFSFTRTQFQWWRVGLPSQIKNPRAHPVKLIEVPNENPETSSLYIFREKGPNYQRVVHTHLPWHPGHLFLVTHESEQQAILKVDHFNLLSLWNKAFSPSRFRAELDRHLSGSSPTTEDIWELNLLPQGYRRLDYTSQFWTFALSLKSYPHCRLCLIIGANLGVLIEFSVSAHVDYPQPNSWKIERPLESCGDIFLDCLLQLDQADQHPKFSSFDPTSETHFEIERQVTDLERKIITVFPDNVFARQPRPSNDLITRQNDLSMLFLLNPSLSWTQDLALVLSIVPARNQFQIWGFTPQWSHCKIFCERDQPPFLSDFFRKLEDSNRHLKSHSVTVLSHPSDPHLIIVSLHLPPEPILQFLIDLNPSPPTEK